MGVVSGSAGCDGGRVSPIPSRTSAPATFSSSRPRLFVSNVVSRRPGAADFHDVVTELSDSLVHRASLDWDVTWAYAEDDGPALTLERAREADAVVIMGGEDVSPDLYGATAGYRGESVHRRRADLAQIALVRHAVATGAPLLGICRGIQVLAVALGGTLVPDMAVPGHRSETFVHDHRLTRHDVLVDPSSTLARALTAGHDAGGSGTPIRIPVHSAHHQAVADPGPDLAVAATAPDGTIEALEHRDAPVFGVQWHPEDPAADPVGVRVLLDHLRAGRHARAA